MKKELIAHRDPKSPISEVFRTLRTNIQFMNTSKRLKSLLLTSTSPGEGKSWISSNLAVTFAQAGKKVILVDADMRKGRQYTIFGVLPKPGLSNYLSGVDEYDNEDSDKDITQFIQKTEISNLCLLAAGNIPPNPAELLISSKMVNLLEELEELCDIVIVDGTPCELVTDSVILSRLVDSTVIVTAHEQTKKENLKRVVSNIKNVNGNIAGIVINKIPISTKRYEQSYYYGATAPTTGRNNKKKSNTARGKNNSNKYRNKRIQNNNKSRKNKIMEERISQMYLEKEAQKKDAQARQMQKRKEANRLSELTRSEALPYNKSEGMLKEINEYLDKEKRKLGEM